MKDYVIMATYKSLFEEIVSQIKKKHSLRIKQLITKYDKKFLDYLDDELNHQESISSMITNLVNKFIVSNCFKLELYGILFNEADDYIDLSNPVIDEIENLLYRKTSNIIFNEMQNVFFKKN
jgi:hypothetical protein